MQLNGDSEDWRLRFIQAQEEERAKQLLRSPPTHQEIPRQTASETTDMQTSAAFAYAEFEAWPEELEGSYAKVIPSNSKEETSGTTSVKEASIVGEPQHGMGAETDTEQSSPREGPTVSGNETETGTTRSDFAGSDSAVAESKEEAE
jgi:hypothetical protein